jgi:hypothetical protein
MHGLANVKSNTILNPYSSGVIFVESDPNSVGNLFFLAGSTSVLCSIKPYGFRAEKKGLEREERALH